MYTSSASFSPSLSAEEFLAWLRCRVAAGESLSAIGRSMGVSCSAVRCWLAKGSGISNMALVLASHLYRAPVDLSPGLPVGSDPAGG